VAFLGGAAIALWITDPAAPAVRATDDVDVIVEVGSLIDYYALGEQLRARGFVEDDQSDVLCRWRHSNGLKLDVMPTKPEALGFSNEWYPDAFKAAVEIELPSKATIRAVPPPYLFATKLAAFAGRGGGDYLASRDFGDIVVLLDGREELVAEIVVASPKLRTYIAVAFAKMATDDFFESGIAGALLPDRASQARAALVKERIAAIVASAPS
jgi:predicted nucleotidyltransferase